MWSRNWPAPAKINRFLRITGRRDDGYHLLQTVFQFLDFGDSLSFELLPGPDIERTGGLPELSEDQDLVVRAARALQSYRDYSGGVRIHLDKQIPHGGGLGGGSSDAATVLVALNRLWSLEIGLDNLKAIGLGLGADVPVFVHGEACWAEGVGEKILPVSPRESWLVLVTPALHASTAEVFTDTELKRDSAALKLSPAAQLDALLDTAGNDCEPVVRRLYPQVGEAIDNLQRCAGNAWLSGTGASVFAIAESETEAREILVQTDFPGRICRTLNRSPLLDRLALEK